MCNYEHNAHFIQSPFTFCCYLCNAFWEVALHLTKSLLDSSDLSSSSACSVSSMISGKTGERFLPCPSTGNCPVFFLETDCDYGFG